MSRKTEQLSLFHDTGLAPTFLPPKWVRRKRRGAGLLLIARDSGKMLLGLRAAWMSDGCTWSTPGGLVDYREEPVVAAIRELWEELGINLLNHTTELKHTHEAEYDGRPYTTFLVEVETELEARADKYETLAAEWFTMEEAAEEDLHPGLRKSLQDLGLLA